MTPEALLAAASGGLTVAGAACIVAFFTGQATPAGPPPSRWRMLAARWRISPRSAAGALACGLILFAVTGWPVAGLAAIPAVIGIPCILSRRPGLARIAILEALESWTRRLADVLAASRGLEDALIHTAASAPAPIAGPVRELADSLRTRQSTTEDTLRNFAAAIGDPVSDLIASALILAADRRGPGLTAVLGELAADVAKDVTSRREVEAERASHRSALAWIIAFLAAYTVFVAVNRSFAAPFATGLGQFVLAVVAACYAGGLYWLHRLSEMTGPQRFLEVTGEGP